MTSLRLNTCISTIRSIYDETGKYLPSGNYYFTVNEITNHNIIGTLRNNRLNCEYVFSIKKFLKMMSNAQSRLIDFTDLRKEEYMPQYNFPITANNGYFTGEYVRPSTNRVSITNMHSRYVVNYYEPDRVSSLLRRENRILTPSYVSPYRYNPNSSENRRETRDFPESENHDNEIDNKCSICWEPVLRNSKTLLCDHKFHRNCINTWLNQNTTCPLCRREVAPTINRPSSFNRNNSSNINRILRNNVITHSVIFEEIV